ncbi:hypothetical protein L1887_29797 [Cichorium endivia]|nr:hypothetical protein L1887_29797 [Cichorium endivia]
MAEETTTLSYWLNWRFFLCALWLIIALIAAAILIIIFEVFNKKPSRKKDNEHDVEPIRILYEDETWRTSLKKLHPVWLLVSRLIAFGVMLSIIIANLIHSGPNVLFFYTQWTFILVTFYFGLGSSLSIHGCYKYWNEIGDDDNNNHVLDPERGTCLHIMPINPNNHKETHVRKTAGIWGYSFQIIFQICAGAVVLTDSVFWFIIYPIYLRPTGYTFNFFDVCLHSLNVILLLIDVILNRLRFPFFRLAYFALWTCIFVIFQWIVHACVSMWWPYPFLDLSSPHAPIWYLGVAFIHLPAYGFFALLVRGKQLLLSRGEILFDEMNVTPSSSISAASADTVFSNAASSSDS